MKDLPQRPRKVAAGNWKMNGTRAALDQLDRVAAAARSLPEITSVICPPAPLLSPAIRPGLCIGGQDCHTDAAGAHTGEISAEMLRDAGANHVILGHSERRTKHGENDALISSKMAAAWHAGLTAILCIGESETAYARGDTLDVLLVQLRGSLPDGATPENTIVAYEPVWAIGTGQTPTPREIASVHRFIRNWLDARFERGCEISLLYGGSVTPDNAAEIFATEDVDGALVGGASLRAENFVPIMTTLARQESRHDF